MFYKQQGHISLYLLTLLCSFAGIACIGFIIYTLPHTLFGLQYNVPLIITQVRVWYEAHYGIPGTLELFAFYVPIILLATLFFIIARYLDRFLETHHERGVPDLSEEELKDHEKYTFYPTLPITSTPLAFKPIFLVLGIILIILLFAIAGEYLVLINLFRP